ncbi:MAG: Epoxyqueuosine reductase [Candidatus Hydrogenedentes bacterium ADurb.Bin101]|nr:MAG: Epoxyqueuosine reductase [Candidatus Hydrogenedentes bacterium ADurb.Bin101]
METVTALIKEKALELGFDDCRVASTILEGDEGFDCWLEHGFHADMDWMARTRDLRQHVQLKVPGARSVIVLAKTYYRPDTRPMPENAKIARYARQRDYHRALIKPLKGLADYVRDCMPGTIGYASVDSGPVRERAWAARAGMGWIGRNGLVIHPRFGSWFFLATIITDANLVPDDLLPERCGTCTACVGACPTGAIVGDREVDARRCIAYHTIENRQEIPETVAANLCGWVFGCDICQEVCPWNRRQVLETAAPDGKSETFPLLDAEALASISEDAFRRLFEGTPIMRAGYGGITRNARLNGGYRE